MQFFMVFMVLQKLRTSSITVNVWHQEPWWHACPVFRGFESNLRTYNISTSEVNSRNFNENLESHNEFSTHCGSKNPSLVQRNDVSCWLKLWSRLSFLHVTPLYWEKELHPLVDRFKAVASPTSLTIFSRHLPWSIQWQTVWHTYSPWKVKRPIHIDISRV